MLKSSAKGTTKLMLLKGKSFNQINKIQHKIVAKPIQIGTLIIILTLVMVWFKKSFVERLQNNTKGRTCVIEM
ncbi:hypothetical protein E1I18_02630 [Mycoplasmopsis mucosicanis]|uniref:Uncharacterized protein n=1 Tax=Mycoplasmopsis mucosicanis TaxID=458208 RepID=A0A507SMK3_9BACT|nr:hypothetical protein [Mycoplasmopsis mucosicanis]TQC51455.1 hypothetical protein E1I18_02630 [Mycoplasmopsis mucosicanis]